MVASSNGDRKRKAPEGREMTHSPPPPGFPIPLYQMAAGAGTGVPPPPLNLDLLLDQSGEPSQAPPPQFPTPAPPLHLHQQGASSSMPHAPQPLKHINDLATVAEAGKKLMEKYEEIEEVEAMLARYRTQALAMAERHKALQETNAALNAALHGGGGGGDGVVRIICKICWREAVTMMGLPCRHLCLCNNCARTTHGCPICHTTFQDCIEVKFY